MQSAYVLGLAILSMAISPKMLDSLTGNVDRELAAVIGVYRFEECLDTTAH